MNETIPTTTKISSEKIRQAKKVKPFKKALFKKDILTVIKEVGFTPEDRVLLAIHSIADLNYCINRAKEVLVVLETGKSKSEKREQVIMAIRLLLLSLIIDPAVEKKIGSIQG